MSCITEILKLKGEQEFLPSSRGHVGVEGGGTYKGYEYLITLTARGIRCGYVALHPEHVYNNADDYDDLDIEVHGGITFMDDGHDLKDLLPIPCSDRWIGFDCGHAWDLYDAEKVKQYFGDEVYNKHSEFMESMNNALRIEFGGDALRDFHYVENQCKHVIDQLIAVK